MAEVKVYYDPQGKTLTVWFDNPQDEFICEETAEEIVLMKNQAGSVIGFEKLNYVIPADSNLKISFEAAAI